MLMTKRYRRYNTPASDTVLVWVLAVVVSVALGFLIVWLS